eukprot:5438604-Pleurochrysis_carterae.AAC.1
MSWLYPPKKCDRRGGHRRRCFSKCVGGLISLMQAANSYEYLLPDSSTYGPLRSPNQASGSER